MSGPARSVGARALLALYSALALCVFAIDSFLYRHGGDVPGLQLAADARLPSLLLVVALVTSSCARGSLRTPSAPSRRLWIATVAWWVGAFVSVRVFGVGRVPLSTAIDVVAFVVTGALVEELVCRALVFDAAERSFSKGRWSPIVISAVVFALLHHQHHGYRFDSRAWAQCAWTFPFGLLTGRLRHETRSVWAPWGVHVVNNAMIVVAQQG